MFSMNKVSPGAKLHLKSVTINVNLIQLLTQLISSSAQNSNLMSSVENDINEDVELLSSSLAQCESDVFRSESLR